MERIILVTGANGHLGNNLVRTLVAKGERVRAGVRKVDDKAPFVGVNCDITHADLLEKQSLIRALDGVDTLYQVAAVFKHWAADPQKEIIQPNLLGTKNIMEAAAHCKVKKIIYVSSIAALDGNQRHIDETGWNDNPANPYYLSKTESEKLALKLAAELNLFLVRVLPAAMIGPHCYGTLTPTMKILDAVLKNQQPVDVNFYIHFVSIIDVVRGMIAAAKRGRNGERYIFGNKSPISTFEIFNLAKSIYPNVKIPPKLPRQILILLAFAMKLASKFSGQEPPLTPDMIKIYHKNNRTLNLTKSNMELGYRPQNPLAAIKSSMTYLMERSCG